MYSLPTWFKLEFFKFIHKDYTTKEQNIYILNKNQAKEEHLKQWHTLAEEHDRTYLSRNTPKPMYKTYRLSRIGVDVGPLSLM